MFEIGNSLREARLRHGLEYTEVELATKIRGKYIRALEDEQFEILPGVPYIKGFLRTYAEYLGLDGQLYVDEYNSRYVVGDGGGREETPLRRPPGPRRDRGVERRVVVLALLGIAAVAALVIVAWRFGGASSPRPAVVEPQTPPATSATPAAGLRLTGVGKGSYVVVRRNTKQGKLLLQGTVARGRVERIAGARFYLFVRRPAGLRVRLGGKAVALPAQRNLRVVVTPDRTSRVSG